MKQKIGIGFITLLILLVSGSLTAQDQKKIAYNKGMEAIALMEKGEYEASIKLLKEAQKLDPTDINYPYEIGYAYYGMKNYKKASKQLEGILNHPDVNPRIYQLLGNSYDMDDKSEKAHKTYAAGRKTFPNAGMLYFESGIIHLKHKEYFEALNFFENGIKAEPTYPSNYYWASKIYLSTEEEIWGMIYGELFMNLERNGVRNSEIGGLLYSVYTKEIKLIGDTSISVSFSAGKINVDAISDLNNFKLPYGIGVYEPTLMMSLLDLPKVIDIAFLNQMRTKFVANYFKNGHDKTYPNILFSYQQKMIELGHFEAYNYWLLMTGDKKAFESWMTTHETAWNNFIDWYNPNPIEITPENAFHSSNY